MLAGKQGTGLTWTRLNSGEEILVPLTDYVGRAAYFVGDLDGKVTGVIRRIVRPGDHVMDIGANLGVVSLRLASLVGGSGVVHSFEPNPALNSLLRQSLDRNRFDHARLHKVALGSQDGQTLTLTYPEENAGKGSLSASPGASEGDVSVEIQVRAISQLAKELDLSRIRFVKIDVEGYETEVLRGASDWLSSHPPDAILLESSGLSETGEPDPALSLLAESDYQFFSLPRQLVRLCLEPFQFKSGQELSCHDILAVHAPCVAEITGRFAMKQG